MQLLLFDGFNGLIQGAFYALLALGLSLIISLNSVINFAHGGFMVIGAYLAYALVPYLGFWGALVVGPLLTGVLGILVERGLIRFMYARSDPVYSLLLTFGLALIIENAVRSIWGRAGRALPPFPSWLGTPVSSTYFFVTGYRLFVMAAIALASRRFVRFSPILQLRRPHPRRHPGPGNGFDAWRERLHAASRQFRDRHSACRFCRRSCVRRPATLADDG